MKSKPISTPLLVLSLFMATLNPQISIAQAYVDQARNAQDGGVYIPQASPQLRRPLTKTNPRRGHSTTAQQNVAQNNARSNETQFPTVGAGSSAIVKIDADQAAWPTVGDGLRK